ncbi:hypothetical protein ACRB68_35580 [Actinomadura sp. RB68]|uniref:Uncharacterized protein n=1 Tax=Actinomadura macrotermitis TaxID=2585200 RepID=A0A7K0BX88_9ACTN|nr:hypothetical protein [Actinomadura macrotermitis]
MVTGSLPGGAGQAQALREGERATDDVAVGAVEAVGDGLEGVVVREGGLLGAQAGRP